MTDADWTWHRGDKAKEEVSFTFPTTVPRTNEKELYCMHAKKVENDSEFVALYANSAGIVYKTMKVYGFPYPREQELHIYRNEGTTSINIRDEWENKYYSVDREALQTFTRGGMPIIPLRAYAPLETLSPTTIATTRPDRSRYNVSTPRYLDKIAPRYEEPHVGLDPGVREPQYH